MVTKKRSVRPLGVPAFHVAGTAIGLLALFACKPETRSAKLLDEGDPAPTASASGSGPVSAQGVTGEAVTFGLGDLTGFQPAEAPKALTADVFAGLPSDAKQGGLADRNQTGIALTDDAVCPVDPAAAASLDDEGGNPAPTGTPTASGSGPASGSGGGATIEINGRSYDKAIAKRCLEAIERVALAPFGEHLEGATGAAPIEPAGTEPASERTAYVTSLSAEHMNSVIAEQMADNASLADHNTGLALAGTASTVADLVKSAATGSLGSGQFTLSITSSSEIDFANRVHLKLVPVEVRGSIFNRGFGVLKAEVEANAFDQSVGNATRPPGTVRGLLEIAGHALWSPSYTEPTLDRNGGNAIDRRIYLPSQGVPLFTYGVGILSLNVRGGVLLGGSYGWRLIARPTGLVEARFNQYATAGVFVEGSVSAIGQSLGVGADLSLISCGTNTTDSNAYKHVGRLEVTRANDAWALGYYLKSDIPFTFLNGRVFAFLDTYLFWRRPQNRRYVYQITQWPGWTRNYNLADLEGTMPITR